MSRPLVEELRLGWIDLEASVRAGECECGSVRRVGVGQRASSPLRLSVRDGCRALLIEGRFADEIAAHATQALHIGSQVRELDGRRLVFVELLCLQPRLNDVFLLIAADIGARLARGDSPQSAIVDAIREFRDLLRVSAAPVLSLEECMGLFGELTLLEKLVATDVNAIAYWSGPLRGRRDFCSRYASMEVKTTRNRTFSSIEIASIDQLHTDDGEYLYLYALALEQVASGESIPELVDRILEHGVDAERLMSLLVAAGYDDPIRSQLTERRFSIWEERLYRVDTDFPKLTRHSFVGGALPLAVRDVRYSLDLAHAQRFLLSREAQEGAIRFFLRGPSNAA